MKPAQIIKHYLSFSRGEQRGTVIFISIILLVNLLRIFLPDVKQMKPVDFAAFSREIESFEEALEQARSMSVKNQPSTALHDPGERQDSTKNERGRENSSFIIELNRADTFDLQRIRGIGPSFARRITGYRKRLGGFHSVDQLLEVYGMDSVRFLGVRKYLTVDTTMIRRLELNTISFKELIAHPYMPYDLAKEIALSRKRHNGIKSLGEILKMKSADSLMLVRLRPYLGFN